MSKQSLPKVCAHTPCADDDALHRWIQNSLGLNIPRRAVCKHHQAPFDYLLATYFEPANDVVVWAPRGGGKTRLAAIATLLDLLHKPGTNVRILGGSLEQSLRMWEHLIPDLEQLRIDFPQHGTSRKISVPAVSTTAAVLTQSQRAVRGLRVQKLRCDEVELFDPGIWEAAQLVTRSNDATQLIDAIESEDRRGAWVPQIPIVNGTVEAISTFHAPFGLMSRLVDSAQERGKPVIRWCLLEVLQKCEQDRNCNGCPLWDECQGIAKEKCDGFVPIDDAIAMKRRVSLETWESEMLCRRPSVSGCVFPNFDPSVHVKEGSCRLSVVSCPPQNGDPHLADNRQLTTTRLSSSKSDNLSLAVDFGFANPFVCLWVSESDGVVRVIDEYVQEARTVEEHLAHIEKRQWGKVRIVACDPAGSGRNDQTAMSNVQLLRKHGYNVRHRPSRIVEGIEMIRAALKPALGEPQLYIHPRCIHLIRSLREYHYAQNPLARSELPLKDGVNDHLIDALRYYYMNRHTASCPTTRPY